VTFRVWVRVAEDPKLTLGLSDVDVVPSEKVHNMVGDPVTLIIGAKLDPVVVKVMFSSVADAVPANSIIIKSVRNILIYFILPPRHFNKVGNFPTALIFVII
jgi:hypothetical protein